MGEQAEDEVNRSAAYDDRDFEPRCKHDLTPVADAPGLFHCRNCDRYATKERFDKS